MPIVRRNRPLLTLLIVFGLLVSLMPAVALAASSAPAPAQASGPAAVESQVYVSDLLPAASSPGRLITLELNADGSATWSTDYLNGEAPIVETGVWEAGAEEGTFDVSITGNEEGAYEEPVNIVFAEEADGTLVTVEWDETIFGSEGLTLLPAQNPELAGQYLSGTLPAASSPGREITLDLAYNGTASWSTDFLNDEPPILELGEWSANDAGTELSLTLTGRPDRTYDAPVEWLFAVEEDGSLTAIEWDETLYGSQTITLARAVAMAAGDPSPAGVWISDILPSTSSPGQVVFLVLNADGTLQSSTWYLDNELPIIELGTWNDNGDGTINITVTGSTEGSYSEAQELIFDFDGATLTYLSLVLNRVPEAGAAPAAEPVALYTSETLPAASSPGREISLILFDDGSAQMITDFLNDEDPIVEFGEWTDGDEGTLTLTLTGREELVYDEPTVIVFEQNDDGTLTASQFDADLYGEGFSLSEQNLDEMLMDEGDETPTLSATPAATETVAAEVPTTDEAAAEEPAAGDAPALEIPPFEVPQAAAAVYTSGLRPAASSPGIVSYLVIFGDGSCQMVTDYLNGEAPIIEIGSCEENADGELVVTLLGPVSSLYAEPVVTTYAMSDGTLTAVEWDEAIYGSEPPTMTLYDGDAAE